MKVLVASDAWHPQVNGVVRCFERMVREAPAFGAELDVVGPAEWRTVPLPSYPEIKLALPSLRAVRRRIEESQPDFIHIATEGPIGFQVRRYCLERSRIFTTSYHTQFPQYVRARAPVPPVLTYAWLRRFHNAGRAVMVTNTSLKSELESHGFRNIMLWSRGVDTELFRPREEQDLDLPRPIFLYVGRVAVEKNLDAFLSLHLPGTKVVTGAGPQLEELKRRYPAVVFTGVKKGEDLARVYASADVFVFPSRTDTFGLVVLEALASGVPVAAYPVMGPRDVLGQSECGVLDEDLRRAALAALEIPRERCRAYALTQSWSRSAEQFLNNILVANDRPPLAVAA
jgi:glycosyltransferase involved in cell wall biosynthesis